MAKRRSSIAHRFARIKGLPPEEKALMQRIGNLLDAAVNNRMSSNPFEKRKNLEDRRLPSPTNILVKTGFKTVKIIWDPIDSSILLRYEVDFTNFDTGVTTTKSTFTNEIIFKGKSGRYKAVIRGVGRNSKSSPLKTVEFGIGEDVMFIEGGRNGPATLGTVVQDNVSLLAGYSLYIWGSVVLDKLAAGLSNNSVVFQLLRAETGNASINDATLVEQIILYPATESASNLDDNAQGGLITRATTVRIGTFETSQSLMFSPISIDTADDGKTVTYFLRAMSNQRQIMTKPNF